MLEALGISAEAENLYVVLAQFNRATVSELAERSSLASDAVRDQLEQMRRLGLAVEASKGTWQSLGLLDVVESLRRQRLSDIEAAAAAAETINGRLLAAAEAETDSVRTVLGLPAMVSVIHQIMNQAAFEICSFDKPPYGNWVDASIEQLDRDSPEWQAVRRGVRTRCVYHPGFDEKRLQVLTLFTRYGEQARMGHVPMKLVIIDSKVAFVPSTRTYRDGREMRGSLIRNPLLIQSLQTMFDEVWDNSVPLAAARASAQPDPRREILVSLLMAGSTDQSIATKLRVNERSVRRWIAELMAELGVQTRLQLGMALVRVNDLTREHRELATDAADLTTVNWEPQPEASAALGD